MVVVLSFLFVYNKVYFQLVFHHGMLNNIQQTGPKKNIFYYIFLRKGGGEFSDMIFNRRNSYCAQRNCTLSKYSCLHIFLPAPPIHSFSVPGWGVSLPHHLAHSNSFLPSFLSCCPSFTPPPFLSCENSQSTNIPDHTLTLSLKPTQHL